MAKICLIGPQTHLSVVTRVDFFKNDIFDFRHPVGRTLHQVESVDGVRDVRLGADVDVVYVVVDVPEIVFDDILDVGVGLMAAGVGLMAAGVGCNEAKNISVLDAKNPRKLNTVAKII